MLAVAEPVADADAALEPARAAWWRSSPLRDAAAKVFWLTTAGRLIAVFRTLRKSPRGI